MLYSGIDKKLHHLKELEFIERMLYYETIDVDTFYKELTEFLSNNNLASKETLTTKDLKKVDKFVEEYFYARLDESKLWFLRAYVVGRLLSDSDINARIFNIGVVSRLPKTIRDAAIKYGLTLQESKMMQIAIEESAAEITNTTLATQQAVRNIMVENAKMRLGSRNLEKMLKESIVSDIGELNRDWKRVAVTEINNEFNNGYLSLLEDNSFVVGLSLPDACPVCMKLINGKVYKVRSAPAPNYANMSGKEYSKWAKVWDTEIWEGKNNYGRSGSRRKRIDKNIGNTKENLREKKHHEFNTPVLPLHPNDRCRWMAFNPEFQYVDKNGVVRLKVEDEDEWENFNKKLLEKYK